MTQFFDVVKTFEDDLKAKVSIPVENKSIPTGSVSMRVALNNENADGLFLNSPVRSMTGQFNVEISDTLGMNKYQMFGHAAKILDVYGRGYTLTVDGLRMVVTQSNQSSTYPTDAHQKINVIIDFQLFA